MHSQSGWDRFEEGDLHRGSATLPGARWKGRGLLVAFLLGGVAACGGDAQADGSAQEEGFERIINVEVMELVPEVFEERVRLSATVQGNRDVVLSAEESGVIREIMVERGTVVQEGAPLFRIDDRTLRAQVQEAEARSALASETWERRRRLFEEDGVGAELAYLEARYQAEQAEAVLSNLRERLDRTTIRAPIAGILETREVEVGTMVSAGTPVARIVQVDPVKVIGGVAERFAGEVSPGSSATVTFDVLPGEVQRATVGYVGATVSARNRTFEVEIVLPNPGRIIKPEMVANVEIVRRTLEDAIVVPQEAVVRVEDGFVAFVAGEANGRPVAEVRALVLGSTQRNQVVVEDGLRAGDRLIVLGQNQVAHGDRIQIVRTREASAPGGGS